MVANVFLAGSSLQPGNGGIARVTRLMSRVLSDEVSAGRLDAAALTVSDPEPCKEFGIPVTSVGGRRAAFFWAVHTAALRYSVFLYDHLGVSRAHCRLPLFRRPFLSWIHGVEIWESARPIHLRLARRAAMILVNSQYTLDRADRLHGCFGHGVVCWLATETDDPPPSSAPCGRRPTVLILGRIQPERPKGHHELIACWPHVVTAIPDARLRIVGTGPGLAALRQQAAASTAASNIDFHGFVPDSQMETMWTETTVFAMPSRGEGFGLVYIEAMRQGIPVIASIHDAAPEINLNGVTGYNVNLENPEELPERLTHLLKNPDQAAELGRNGQARWREHFRYSGFKSRFLPLLRNFLQC